METIEKKELDWKNLDFSYRKTDYSYVCNFKDGTWEEGELTKDHTITLSECAGIFHYCQEVFEGLKAYTTVNGSIACFRPDLNAKRMADSAERLCMPPFPEEKFVSAIKQVIKANEAWVPPYGTGATLYVRPIMIATGDVLGVHPASEYQFRILVSPVGPYFKGGDQSVTLTIADYDRAAPAGTGNVKAGLNYALSMKPTMLAKSNGYADNLYLDSKTRTSVEETGGANILFVDKQGTLVVPKSSTNSILPSITRKSLVHIAKDILQLPVEERIVNFNELLQGDFVECGLCGTAAVISPVGHIEAPHVNITFPHCAEASGPIMKKLRKTLTDMQTGLTPAPEGWITIVE